MKSCKNCTVTVTGDFNKCPLCQNALVGEAADDNFVFPYVPIVTHEHSMLFRLLLLCSAVVVIVSVAVNWMLPQSGFWSLFVVFGVVCAWISLLIAIRKRHNILKNLTYQVTVISLAALLWDVFTGWYGWSVDFVIPIAFASTMSTTAILARVLKMKVGTYIIYLFLLIIYGIIPIAFVLSGLCKIVYPSIICVSGSLLSLVALFIFEGKNITDELKRRLHL